MSAYACSPGRGSEAYIAHQWVLQMARFCDVTVFTDARNRSVTESFSYPPGVRFEYIKGLGRDVRTGRGFRDWRGLEWASYWLFLVRSYVRARKLLRERPFDLTHHVSYATFRWPFMLTLLPRPSILGPVGGAEFYPPGFPRTLYERVRWLMTWMTRLDPLVQWTLRRSTVIMAGNYDTMKALPVSVRPKARWMQTGVDPKEFTAVSAVRKDDRFVILWAGLLIRRKALDLLVAALPRVREALGSNVRVIVHGDGPERLNLERMAAQKGVADLIEFRGWTSRRDVLESYAEGDVFCFTTLRDTFGLVVLEAMAAGLPVVCLDHSGPGEMVTADSGIAVAPRSPAQVVEGLAAALIRLGRDPSLRRALAAGARRRIEETYAWDVLGEEMYRLYQEIAS
jgi:glycosyltransferase involved in cell wall biosynthesis